MVLALILGRNHADLKTPTSAQTPATYDGDAVQAYAADFDIEADDPDPPMRGGWHFASARDSVAVPMVAPEPEVAPAAPVLAPVGPLLSGLVTHYGPRYNGQSLGCGGGVYTSANAQIIAVGPTRYREWPCGTMLQVCGVTGCIQGMRVDSCPGCSASLLDLSEAGIALVCGDQAHVCRVQIQRLQWSP